MLQWFALFLRRHYPDQVQGFALCARLSRKSSTPVFGCSAVPIILPPPGVFVNVFFMVNDAQLWKPPLRREIVTPENISPQGLTNGGTRV